jgi:hypothetical protein
MKNKKEWKPTKFVKTERGMKHSEDEGEVSVRSRIMVNTIAKCYYEEIKKFAKGNLLDAGCGKVPLYKMYESKVKNVDCTDWTDGKHVDFKSDLNKKIPVKDKSYDTVIATDVIEHLQKPKRFFGECERVMDDKANMILGSPFLYCIHEEPYDYHRYTKYSLKKMCRQAGLKVKKIYAYGGGITSILDLVGKNFDMGRKINEIYQNTCIWFMSKNIVKKMDEERKSKFPLGYCMVARKK